MFLKCTHDTDGEVLAVDSVYDSKEDKIKIVYVKSNGIMDKALLSKFVVIFDPKFTVTNGD